MAGKLGMRPVKVVLDIKPIMAQYRIRTAYLAHVSGVAERSIVTIRQGKAVTVFVAMCVVEALSKITSERKAINE
jgi:DNA-binding Xre family transcriptional regulator